MHPVRIYEEYSLILNLIFNVANLDRYLEDFTKQ
jgi:hypothetical protein